MGLEARDLSSQRNSATQQQGALDNDSTARHPVRTWNSRQSVILAQKASLTRQKRRKGIVLLNKCYTTWWRILRTPRKGCNRWKERLLSTLASQNSPLRRALQFRLKWHVDLLLPGDEQAENNLSSVFHIKGLELPDCKYLKKTAKESQELDGWEEAREWNFLPNFPKEKLSL